MLRRLIAAREHHHRQIAFTLIRLPPLHRTYLPLRDSVRIRI
jgi:hypothetical protein